MPKKYYGAIAAACSAIYLIASCPINAEEAVVDLSTPAETDGIEGQVIGGRKVPASSWPATLVFRGPRGNGCTATVVGPKTVLTAAHCVPNNAAARVNKNGQIVNLKCTHHPQYASDYKADYALCAATSEIQLPEYAYVNTSASTPRDGSQVILLGYGCLTAGGGDRKFGALYQGSVNVKKREGLYFITVGKVAVCFGDSGGAVYQADGRRIKVIGVNSRGNISSESYLSRTGSESFVSWARNWAETTKNVICGVSGPFAGCST